MFDLNILRPVLELSSVIPGAVLCYLPMKHHLRRPVGQLLGFSIPTLSLWILAGSLLCWRYGWYSNVWLLPSLPVFSLFFLRTVNLPAWKSVSVLLAICGVFSCLTNLAAALDAWMTSGSLEVSKAWLSLPGCILLLLLYWISVGAAWYPATHAARTLLDEIEMPGTWYVFWMMPAMFMGLNIILNPEDYAAFYGDSSSWFYPFLILALLAMILSSYLMFYLMAKGMGENIRLTQENKFLQMQTAQYRILQNSMEETRRARHDLRHHMAALQGCIASGDLDALSAYITACCQTMPGEAAQTYCKNYAVNAILHYYGEKAALEQTELAASIQMDAQTLIPEPEFCVLLGNLLENALEACASVEGQRFIRLNIRQTSTSMLYLTMDNTAGKAPLWIGEKLKSSRHEGMGMGTESVRMIALRYHGDARFEWKDGIFYISVMLNP